MAEVRNFEFVGSGSAKFWEIGRDGVEVTVRYGRLGTAGQTQLKSFDSEAAATAHVTKLIAEKVKKGYQEAAAEPADAGSASAPPSSPATAPPRCSRATRRPSAAL